MAQGSNQQKKGMNKPNTVREDIPSHWHVKQFDEFTKDLDLLYIDSYSVSNKKTYWSFLTTGGEYYINGTEYPWYKDKESKKPWLVAKRRNFVSLSRQIIRDL